MKIKLYDINAQAVGEVDLSAKTYGVKTDPVLIAQAVRVYLGNQRHNTAKAKNRNEVHGTTKKVWNQKGTGNARHGSRKAPIFVGGGVTHGKHCVAVTGTCSIARNGDRCTPREGGRQPGLLRARRCQAPG